MTKFQSSTKLVCTSAGSIGSFVCGFRKKTNTHVKAYALAVKQQQMVEAKKNERANALKEVKRLCKEFGFTAGMLKGALAEGRKKQ